MTYPAVYDKRVWLLRADTEELMVRSMLALVGVPIYSFSPLFPSTIEVRDETSLLSLQKRWIESCNFAIQRGDYGVQPGRGKPHQQVI